MSEERCMPIFVRWVDIERASAIEADRVSRELYAQLTGEERSGSDGHTRS